MPPPFRPPLAIRLAIAALVVTSSSANIARAQSGADSTRRSRDTLSLDSLRARLERAEAAIALLREQLASESQSAAHSRSRMHLELSAQVLTNSFVTLGRVNNVDVPQTALSTAPIGTTPATDNAAGLTLRQTRLGLAASVDDVLGATLASDVDFDLFGGVQNGPGDRRLFPEPRLRTTRYNAVCTSSSTQAICIIAHGVMPIENSADATAAPTGAPAVEPTAMIGNRRSPSALR